MSDHIKGCGKDDKPLTLYRIPSHGELSPLSAGYYHVRCGYRPPSKIGSAQEFDGACILSRFLKNDKFCFCDRHALRLEQ